MSEDSDVTEIQASSLRSDIGYQEKVLQGVSRTFALTIPELPNALQLVVGNAYLLCRIADTIEDEPALTSAQKRDFSERFIRVVAGRDDAQSFARDLGCLLSASSSGSEHDLIRNSARIIHVSHSFHPAQIDALHRCVKIMARGMAKFQQSATLDGLKDLSEHDRYCYCVAGVVGEMLTQLFCIYSSDVKTHQDELFELAVSFGQGLQMTNILKDMWEDRNRGVCWLPRDVFETVDCNLSSISATEINPRFSEGVTELVKIAYGHLHSAIRYTLSIPARQTGIRNHCMMALSMALLTLRRIYANPNFKSAREVKISRRSVWTVYILTKFGVRSNTALKVLFRCFAFGLPEVNIQQNIERSSSKTAQLN